MAADETQLFSAKIVIKLKEIKLTKISLQTRKR